MAGVGFDSDIVYSVNKQTKDFLKNLFFLLRSTTFYIPKK